MAPRFLPFIFSLFAFALYFAQAAPTTLHAIKRGDDSFSGDGTFYTVGVGSCGNDNSDSELVAALNAPQMGSSGNPNTNSNCGKKARVKGPKGTVTVTIVDTCPPCKKGDLDLSPAAFAKIADFAQGRADITWFWV